MDKETLSNYGWIVICVLVLAVMIALAGPFGNFVADAVKSTTQGLFDVNQNALNSTGLINIGDNSFADGENGIVGGDYDHNAPELHPTGTIPEGAYYANLNTGTFYAEMPATVSDGDIYLCGDYMYSYSSSDAGWAVRVAATELGLSTYVPDFTWTNWEQTSYGVLLESINGVSVTSLYQAFDQCTLLSTAPVIPSGVVNMTQTFYACDSLITAPSIPSGVTSLDCTFYDCDSLTNVIIPDTVTTVTDRAFFGCKKLESISLPKNIATIGEQSFHACTSLSNIVFGGTMEQWNAITFGRDWNYIVPATEVICSDGTVTL